MELEAWLLKGYIPAGKWNCLLVWTVNSHVGSNSRSPPVPTPTFRPYLHALFSSPYFCNSEMKTEDEILQYIELRTRNFLADFHVLFQNNIPFTDLLWISVLCNVILAFIYSPGCQLEIKIKSLCSKWIPECY